MRAKRRLASSAPVVLRNKQFTFDIEAKTNGSTSVLCRESSLHTPRVNEDTPIDACDADHAVFAASKASARNLELLSPNWYHPLIIAAGIWVCSEFFVLLTNEKRRALHDFMTGTVVIETATAKKGY